MITHPSVHGYSTDGITQISAVQAAPDKVALAVLVERASASAWPPITGTVSRRSSPTSKKAR
jgi:hypothetical protein